VGPLGVGQMNTSVQAGRSFWAKTIFGHETTKKLRSQLILIVHLLIIGLIAPLPLFSLLSSLLLLISRSPAPGFHDFLRPSRKRRPSCGRVSCLGPLIGSQQAGLEPALTAQLPGGSTVEHLLPASGVGLAFSQAADR
jgi:hypothetical protein